MRYRGFFFAIRTRRFRDYVQWVALGTSPLTRPVDIQDLLADIRRRGIFS